MVTNRKGVAWCVSLHAFLYSTSQCDTPASGDVANDDNEMKKICISERLGRTAAMAQAAKSDHPLTHVPPQLASSGGRTPEMRMGRWAGAWVGGRGLVRCAAVLCCAVLA